MSAGASARDPFASTADAQSYIPREATESALGDLASFLRVGATQIVLRGVPGLGKSLLLKVLAARLEGAMRVVEVPYPSLPPEEIARWIIDLMGMAASDDAERQLVQQARGLRDEGSGLAILVDDAASTPLPTLRRLSRIAREARPSLHLVLAIDDDARADQVIEAIGPDVEVVTFSAPMTEEETRAYLDGRLARAGAPEWVRERFSEDAASAIHGETDGLPAEVNRSARRWWSSSALGAPRGPSPARGPAGHATAPAASHPASGGGLGSALLASSGPPVDEPHDPETLVLPSPEARPPATRSEPALSEAPTEIIEPEAIAAASAPEPKPEPAPAPAPPEAAMPAAAATAPAAEEPAAAVAAIEEPRAPARPAEPSAPPPRRTRPVVAGLLLAAAVTAAFALGRMTATLPLFDSMRETGQTADVAPGAAGAGAADAGTGRAEPLAAASEPGEPTPERADGTAVPDTPTRPAPDVAAAPPPVSAGRPAETPEPVAAEIVRADPDRETEAAASFRAGAPTVSVSINAVPWARIEIDGEDYGVTPMADVSLAPGSHEFRAVFGDGREVVRTEEIDDLNRRILFR